MSGNDDTTSCYDLESDREKLETSLNKVPEEDWDSTPTSVRNVVSALLKLEQDTRTELEKVTKDRVGDRCSAERLVKLLNRAIVSNTKDSLTGLPNAVGFNDKASILFGYIKNPHTDPRQGTPIVRTAIALDLDGFKGINDAFSHEAGDKALQFVAKFLKEKLPKNHIIARTGGDEFKIMFDGDETQARKKLNELRKDFDSAWAKEAIADKAFLSFSFGTHPISKTDDKIENSFVNADINASFEKNAEYNPTKMQFMLPEKNETGANIKINGKTQWTQTIVPDSKMDRAAQFYAQFNPKSRTYQYRPLDREGNPVKVDGNDLVINVKDSRHQLAVQAYVRGETQDQTGLPKAAIAHEKKLNAPILQVG
jgi:diguanylate cyclase (GGDEF)-like protein